MSVSYEIEEKAYVHSTGGLKKFLPYMNHTPKYATSISMNAAADCVTWAMDSRIPAITVTIAPTGQPVRCAILLRKFSCFMTCLALLMTSDVL